MIAALAAANAACSHHSQAAKATPPAQIIPIERQVQNAIYAGEGDLKVKELRKKLAEEPANLEVRLELIRHFRKSGSPELALEHARVAAERFPDSPEAVLEVSKSLEKMEMLVEATAVLEGYMSNHAVGSAELFSWLGMMLDRQGRFTEGEGAHRMAVAKMPNSDAVHNNLGYCLLRQGKKQEAEAEFRRALHLSPGSEIARINLGLALADRPQEAIRYWQSVAGPAAAHNNLAAVRIEEGRYQEARQEIETALRYNRQHPAALKNLSLVSDLDQKGTTVAPPAEPGHWKKFWASVKKAVSGSPESKQEIPPQTRNTNHEESAHSPDQGRPGTGPS